DGLHGNGEQHLFAQGVFHLNAVTGVVSDLGVGFVKRNFVAAPVNAGGAVKQIEAALQAASHRLQTAGAGQFDPGRQLAHQPDIGDSALAPSAVLLNQFGPARSVERGGLPDVGSQVDGAGAKVLVQLPLLDPEFLNAD